jgi:Domian of unknown function (DUF4952)
MKIIFCFVTLLSLTSALPAYALSPPLSPPAATRHVQCADFLALLRHVPAGLEFVDCQYVSVNQHDSAAMQANYRVRGAQAAAVEAYLVNTSGMPPLRFICCGWDSAPRYPRTQRGYGVYRLPKHMRPSADVTQLHISMSSGETLVNQRAAWTNLEYIQVRALLYIQSP